MPFRAGRGPGGVPKFLAQTTVTLAAVAVSWMGCEDSGLVRQSKLIYDPYAGPVGAAPAAPVVVQTLVDNPSTPARARKRTAVSDIVAPLFVPDIAVAAQFDTSAPSARKRVQRPQSEVVTPLRTPDVVVAGIDTTLTATGDGGSIRYSRLLYDPYAGPVGVEAGGTATPATLASTSSSLIIQTQRVFLDEVTQPWSEAPVAGTATPTTLASTSSSLIVRTQRVFSDEVTQPWSAAPTPPAGGTAAPDSFFFDAGGTLRNKKRDRSIPRSAFVFAIPDDIYPPADNNQPPLKKGKRAIPQELVAPPQNVGGAVFVGIATTITAAFESPTVIRSKKLYDPYAGPVLPPIAQAGTSTPTTLASTSSSLIVQTQRVFSDEVVQPWSAAPAGIATPSFLFDWTANGKTLRVNKTAVADNNGFVWAPHEIVPPAGTPVPSFLFDWTANGKTLRVNKIAVADNNGFVWSPQEIAPPPAPVARTQKDGDPDYWKLPWFRVEGGTFSERLHAKTLASLDEAVSDTDAESAAPSVAAEAVREYVEVAGLLFSEEETAALGELAQQLRVLAEQAKADLAKADLARQKAAETRALLLELVIQQRDEEESLIALGIY